MMNKEMDRRKFLKGHGNEYFSCNIRFYWTFLTN